MEPERYRPGKTCYTPILLGYSRGRSVVRFVAMSLVERLARGCPGTASVPDLAAIADSSPDRGYKAKACGDSDAARNQRAGISYIYSIIVNILNAFFTNSSSFPITTIPAVYSPHDIKMYFS